MAEIRVEIALPNDVVEAVIAAVTDRVLAEVQRDDARRWLSVPDAALELGLSEGALRKHIARGNVRSERIGTRLMVDMQAIGEP